MGSQEGVVTRVEDQIQTVILTFADGSKASFTGKATVYDTTVTVAKIEFTEPFDLPEDYSFEEIK